MNLVDPWGLMSFDPFTGVPTDLMKPIYQWFNNTFGEKPPSAFQKGFDKIYNGLSRDIPRAYKNAHPAAQMCLDVALTITEFGATYNLPKYIQIPYDIYSGANFNTIPLSPASWLGHEMFRPLY